MDILGVGETSLFPPIRLLTVVFAFRHLQLLEFSGATLPQCPDRSPAIFDYLADLTSFLGGIKIFSIVKSLHAD